MIKDPRVRVRLVDWEHFRAVPNTNGGGGARQRVTDRVALIHAQQSEAVASTQVQLNAKKSELENTAFEFMKNAIRYIRSDRNVFPPIKVVRVPGGGNILRVHFDASAAHRMNMGLYLFTKLEVLDPLSGAMVVSACAFAGENPLEPFGDDCQAVEMFQGIYNGPAVYKAFENYVYTVIDRVQQVSLPGDGGWIAIEGG